MMDVSQAAQAVSLHARPALAPVAPKQRTTSASQPPSPRARHLLAFYANLFGAGLFVVFAAAALAMLAELGEAEHTKVAWWQLWNLPPPWWQLWNLPPWHLVALLVCSLPYILAFGAANLYRWSAFSRYDFRLVWQERSANPSLNDDDWAALAQRAVKVWNYESRRFSESRRMASLHGLIFGLVSSLTLFICTMILAPYLYGNADASKSELALVAIAVGTATAFAFANDLGRIIFRVALRDAGAEIFSFATKNSILVVASALLFSTLLCSGLAQINQPTGGADHAIPLGVPGFIVIGATISILGGRAVRFVSDRAAGVLGMGATRVAETSDLTQIEGLDDDDIGRLAEEGVDSLHSLAFIPLPRLLFNTKYGLERLCDWQDQALLLAHIGQAKARLLRDHLLVRGALAAQDAARQFFSGAHDDCGSADAKSEESMQDKLANLLGFASYAHAKFALNELASDEVVNRLRVYATAAHTIEWSDDEDGEGA